MTKTRGRFPTDDAVVKLLWLAIFNIEDKRARERAAAAARPASAATSPCASSKGSASWGWREALSELAVTYPGRIR